MSVFSIDTEQVSSVANDISSLSSSSSSVASSVGNYNTTNEDGFDFSGAKSAIENNVDGMKTKVSNTSVLLDAVVSTHSSLQNSVSGGDGNINSNYGSYNYSGSVGGGYNYGGGGGTQFAGGFGDKLPASVANKRADSSVATVSSVSASLSPAELAALDVADPLETPEVESALKDNPSAYDKLKEELGKVNSDVSKAESTLTEELEVVLSSNNIKTISPDGLVAESFGNNLLVVEASTQTVGLAKYFQEVNDVAKEHKIEVRFLSLDEIINFSSSTSLNASTEEEVLTINDDAKKEISDNQEEETNEGEKEKKLPTDQQEETEEKDEKTDEAKEEENTNEVKEEETKEEKQEETTEKESTEDTKEIKQDESVANSKIKNQAMYDKLTNIPTKGNIKNDILKSPVTMIIKDNLIISAETGILSRDRIENLIISSGINKKME